MSKSDQFHSLVQSQPQNELFRFSLGQALLEEENPREALPHLQFCVESRNDWMAPRILLGKARLALNDPSGAREVLSEALELAVAQEHEAPEAEIRSLLEEIK